MPLWSHRTWRAVIQPSRKLTSPRLCQSSKSESLSVRLRRIMRWRWVRQAKSYMNWNNKRLQSTTTKIIVHTNNKLGRHRTWPESKLEEIWPVSVDFCCMNHGHPWIGGGTERTVGRDLRWRTLGSTCGSGLTLSSEERPWTADNLQLGNTRTSLTAICS